MECFTGRRKIDKEKQRQLERELEGVEAIKQKYNFCVSEKRVAR